MFQIKIFINGHLLSNESRKKLLATELTVIELLLLYKEKCIEKLTLRFLFRCSIIK